MNNYLKWVLSDFYRFTKIKFKLCPKIYYPAFHVQFIIEYFAQYSISQDEKKNYPFLQYYMQILSHKCISIHNYKYFIFDMPKI